MIVMPQTTPEIKVEAVRAMGAEVVLAGDSYSEAQAHCDALVPGDRPRLRAPLRRPAGDRRPGHDRRRDPAPVATARLDAVFVPVGGGGLIAGIAGYVKALMPDVKVIGVEPFEADAMYRSLEAGRRVRLEHVGIFADGVAVREVGRADLPRSCGRPWTRSCASRTTRSARRSRTSSTTRAASWSRRARSRSPGSRRWVARDGPSAASAWSAILSGANMNFDRLRFVAERAELGEAREALLGVTIPERPGAFREFCAAIGRASSPSSTTG